MNDRQLLQLISMAQEAQTLADAAGRSSAKAGGGAGEDVIARIGPERVAAEEQLAAARARLAELELARTRWRSQRWRTPAAAAVAAGVVATVMLWPASQPGVTPTLTGSGSGAGAVASVREEPAALALAGGGVATEGVVGGEVGTGDFDRPLSDEPGATRGVGARGWAGTVVVVHRDATGDCDCDRIDVREWTQALLSANPGAQIVYAREGAAAGGAVLTPTDFTCFQQRFLAGDGRGGALAAACASATTPPALSVSDFVCFTRKLAGGCM